MVSNISIVRGDTLAFDVEIDGLEGDLASAYFSVKANYNDVNYVFQKSIGNGITRQESGAYTVRIAPSDTQNLELGQYYYDLQLGIENDVFTILKGIFDIGFDVTREV